MADRGIPSWPKVTIRLYDAHNGEVRIAGRSHPVVAADPREAALAVVVERAARLGRPLKVTAVEADGESWPLVVHPDGNVEAISTEDADRKPVWPILAAAGVAVALVAATIVYLLVVRDTRDAVTRPTVSPTLPSLPGPSIGPDLFNVRPVPPGWSARADWSVDIAEGTHPVVSADGSQIAVLTRNWRLVVVDPAGRVLWQDEVPKNTRQPVFTSVDGREVLAAQTPKALRRWAGGGALPVDIKLSDETTVQFFGRSPLVTDSDGDDPRVVKDGELVPVENRPRFATVLLAQDARALIARYAGPIWWSEPGRPLNEVRPKPPKGAKGIDHIVAASPNRIVISWSAGPESVVAAVHDSQTGTPVAACPVVSKSEAAGWDWVPDTAGAVAAFGECLIDYAKQKTYVVEQFRPLSITGRTIFGEQNSRPVRIVPGTPPAPLADGTARPWAVVDGGRALVLHAGVLYALPPAAR